MSWTVVAEKDIRDASRSKTLWVVSLLFIIFAAGVAYLYSQVSALQQGGFSTIDFIGLMRGPIVLFVPVLGLLLGYKAVAGEVETGSVKLLLSLPHSRANVVLGKFIGRLSVLSVAIVAGFTVATAVVLALIPVVSPMKYVLFILLTMGLGAAYVSIAIGLSSLTKSTTKAGAGIFGVFIFINMLWMWIGRGINWVLNGQFFVLQPPDWLVLYSRLSPNGAFNSVLGAVVTASSVEEAFTLTPQPDDPVYLSMWVSLLILLAWIVLPAGIGYFRFRSVDL